MTTLAKINGEALSVPGLRFWGHRAPFDRTRVAIIASNERGAIEVWSEQNDQRAADILGRDTFGGIEIHSPKPLYDFSPQPTSTECLITRGAGIGDTCWSDGSLLAYDDQVMPLLRANDSAGLLRLLADWHASHFPA